MSAEATRMQNLASEFSKNFPGVTPPDPTAGGASPSRTHPSPASGQARGASAPVLGPNLGPPQLFSRGCAPGVRRVWAGGGPQRAAYRGRGISCGGLRPRALLVSCAMRSQFVWLFCDLAAAAIAGTRIGLLAMAIYKLIVRRYRLKTTDDHLSLMSLHRKSRTACVSASDRCTIFAGVQKHWKTHLFRQSL